MTLEFVEIPMPIYKRILNPFDSYGRGGRDSIIMTGKDGGVIWQHQQFCTNRI